MPSLVSRCQQWLWPVCLLVLIGLMGDRGPLRAAAPETIALWPTQKAPGETGDIGPEHNEPAKDPKDTIIRTTDVSVPTIAVYRPDPEKDTGAAVVICPGGGYRILAYNLEGTEVAEWLNKIGVTGIVLKYRVPGRKGLERHTAALQDAQRAIGLVRHRASQWKLNPQKIGVLGFSAGGHLAATLSNHYEKRTYEPVDDADQVSCRPDFTLLIYPAYLVKKDEQALVPELPVTSNSPPTFLVHTEDDNSSADSSLFYFLALKGAKVPAELHIYPDGGHGYGLRPSSHTVSTWPDRAETWLRTLGTLEAAK